MTDKAKTEPRDRPEKIEITKEMLAKGVQVFLKWDESENPWPQSLVIALFQQMCMEAGVPCRVRADVVGHEQSRHLGVKIQVD